MAPDTLKTKYDLKELELNALLEITQAINNNLPQESLYKIYDFTLRANLKIKQLALYVKDEDWVCKVNYGTSIDFTNITLDDSFLDFKKIKKIRGKERYMGFNEFDMVIPVSHKDQVLAFVFVGGLLDDEESEVADTNFLQVLSNIILVAIENKKLARQQLQQEALSKELEIARGVQELLFPESLPYDSDLQIIANYLPHQDVSGDYYDYIKINDDQFLLGIADVSGKGIPAAILMSNFQATLRTMARHTVDLKEIITELNYQTIHNARGEHFITFFVAIVDLKNKSVYYANAGHNPPLFKADNQPLQMLELGTTILGIFDPLPFLRVGKLEYEKELLFFSYTDGLTETFNETGEPFEIEPLIEMVESYRDPELIPLHENILIAVDQHKGINTYHDDITMLSCRVKT
ncbi:MAG: PP2C family protein-serine/threonine phosphatase [Cyclobacteriaceae bacterium]